MPHAQILVVDDEPDIRELVSEILRDEGYTVTSARDGESARAAYASAHPDLVLLDIWMPDIDGITLLKEWSEGGGLSCPVVVMSGHATLETAVEATRLGAHDFIQKPLSLAKLLATVKQALGAATGSERPRRSRSGSPYVDPLGQSPQMQLLKQKAEQAARHGSAVLITGEPGSGRETIAAFIHKSSGRGGRLVVLDHCRLGGTEGRAYLLGSGDAAGAFETAAGGTLYIPDIQLLTPEAQTLLALALEAGEFKREGGKAPVGITCRIIAGAPEQLEHLVKQGTVQDQLYFRLNVLPLHVPALRARPEDVPELVRFYTEWFPNQDDLPYRPFSISALNRLRNHSWPGNIRELRNLVQRLLILGGEGEVSMHEVEDALRQNASDVAASPAARPSSFDLPLREAREQFEREYLRYQLGKAGGSVGKLAESVGMERTHLYRKLRSLGIDPKTVGREGEAT